MHVSVLTIPWKEGGSERIRVLDVGAVCFARGTHDHTYLAGLAVQRQRRSWTKRRRKRRPAPRGPGGVVVDRGGGAGAEVAR